jgi:hypothetical protein
MAVRGAARIDPADPPAPAVPGLPADLLERLTNALGRLGHQKKVCTNFFKGDPGEDPEHHVLRAVDWMTDNEVPEAQWPREFRHTLAKWAREWYQEIEVPDNWEDMKRRFTDHYSRQGRSDQQLHHRWRTLSFNPETDNITTFISNVRQTAARLDYNDRAVMNLIKASMPKHVYGSLYSVNELNAVIAMVKDLFAPENENANANAQNAQQIAPFAQMHANENSGSLPHYTPEDLVSNMRNMLSQMSEVKDMEPKPSYKPPWKPRVYPKAQRGRGNRFKNPPRDQRPQGTVNRFDRSRFRGRGRGRGTFRKFDKSPNNRRPRSSSRPVNKDKGRCFLCNEFGHFMADCPQNTGNRNSSTNRGQGQSSFRSRSMDRKSPSIHTMTDNSSKNLYTFRKDDVTGETYFEQLNC